MFHLTHVLVSIPFCLFQLHSELQLAPAFFSGGFDHWYGAFRYWLRTYTMGHKAWDISGVWDLYINDSDTNQKPQPIILHSTTIYMN